MRSPLSSSLSKFVVLSAFLVLVTFTGSGSAASSIAQGTNAPPKKQWDELTIEEQQRVKEHFELWKRLPKERKDEMLRRHAELRKVEEDARVGIEPRGPTPGEARPRESGVPVGKLLKQRRGEILGNAGLSPDEIEQLQPDELARIARERAEDRIADLRRRGAIDDAEVARLRALPPPALAKELRRIQKSAFLRQPPPEFLALPEGERRRLAELPPEHFLREMKKVLPPPPGQKPPREFLERFLGKERGPGERPPKPVVDPRQAAVRQWVDAHLSPDERRELDESEPFERQPKLMRILKGQARRALRDRGDDPTRIDDLDALPRPERIVGLIQIVDREFDPGPPPPPRPGRRKMEEKKGL